MKAVISNKQMSIRIKKIIFLISGFLLLFLSTHPAFASNTNGGGMPFDTYLNNIQQSITGPFAFTASIIGLVGAGAGLIFGGDMNGFLRTLIFMVLVLSFIVAANGVLKALTGKSAEITPFAHHHFMKSL